MCDIQKKWFHMAYLTAALLFLSISTASAAVDKVIGVPWQGDVNKQHTAISGGSAEPVPDSITFEWVATGCYAPGSWQFYLNGTSLGTATADPSPGCTCSPPLRSFTVSNATLVGSGAWQTTGGNTLRAVMPSGSTLYSWVRAQVVTGGNTNTVCLGDYNGGTCSELNLCTAQYQYAPVDVTKSTSPDIAASLLKVVIKTTDTSPVWYKWVFGDGSESATASLSGATKYNVDTTHVYAAATGTPFTAKLQVSNTDPFVLSKEGSYLLKIEDNTLDAKINISIDKGLWYLYKNASNTDATYDGSPFMSWQDSNYSVWAAPTASAIQAFAINNHKIKGDPNVDPYVEAVQLGMNYLMKGNNALSAVTGLADGNNGVGIQTAYANHQIYEGGQVMDAIIASGALPDDLTGRNFAGSTSHIWTYREVLQDMADMYIYYQHGGTGYGAGSWGEWQFGSGENDNSSSQWAAIGMLPAQAAPWNIVIPDAVKTKNNSWVNSSFCTSGGYAGSFGYQGACNCNDSCFNTTPCGMVQLNFDGLPNTDSKWSAGAQYMANNWWGLLQDGSGWGNQKTYGFYSFAKAMRLALPNPVEQITKTNGHAYDWYRGGSDFANDANFDKGLAVRILEIQDADGHWAGNLSGLNLTTAWMIIALKPTLFAASPIACFTANPNPSYANADIYFNPSCSGHSESGKTIANLIKFEWDWNNDGVFDASSTTPDTVTHKFACASVPCTFPVKLKVTDDNNPALTATFAVNINITNPPHPPVANPGGPYITSTCSNDSLILDGSKSYDQDQGQHEVSTYCSTNTCPNDTITAWDWDLKAPLIFDAIDATGKNPTVSAANIASFFSVGTQSIGLRVSDNTKLAYPGSGQNNLTNAAFGSVDVKTGCLCELTAAIKPGMVQLNWAAMENGATYNIWRSTDGPNTGFTKISSGYTNAYPLFVDKGLTNGKTYYYRIEKVSAAGGICGSKAVKGTPKSLF